MQQYQALVWANLTEHFFASHNAFQCDSISSSKFFFALPSFTIPFDLIAFIQIGFSFQLVERILSTRQQQQPNEKKTPKGIAYATELFECCRSHSPTATHKILLCRP